MDVFVARQPILDAEQRVYGYELLFRSGLENAFPGTDPTLASTKVLTSSVLSIGLDLLTRGKPAFVNFTRDGLLADDAGFLPSASAVVEIVEDIEPDADVVAACRRLRELGYRLALDDFVYRPELEPLLELASFVKVDFERTTAGERLALVERLRDRPVSLVAEKVETVADYREGLSLGCSHFQGYFFSRPVVYRGQDLRGHRGSQMQLMHEAGRDELDFARVERIVKTDIALSYKLLRYINAVSFGWKQRITSVRHALSLLGQEQVRRWALLVALSSMAERRPPELSVMSAVRGRLCEGLLTLGSAGGDRALDGFMLGMFSLIDALLEQPMAQALEGVPLAEDVHAALLGEPNRARQVLDTVVAYERGDWSALDERAARLGLPEERLPRLYAEAVEWAGAVFD
ncbi:MAG TPA: EAL domain-containing protein [Egibacteraceae bacterium]|nr:EAL domain-containing protein [Egibacteraceae bacterium]